MQDKDIHHNDTDNFNEISQDVNLNSNNHNEKMKQEDYSAESHQEASSKDAAGNDPGQGLQYGQSAGFSQQVPFQGTPGYNPGQEQQHNQSAGFSQQVPFQGTPGYNPGQSLHNGQSAGFPQQDPYQGAPGYIPGQGLQYGQSAGFPQQGPYQGAPGYIPGQGMQNGQSAGFYQQAPYQGAPGYIPGQGLHSDQTASFHQQVPYQDAPGNHPRVGNSIGNTGPAAGINEQKNPPHPENASPKKKNSTAVIIAVVLAAAACLFAPLLLRNPTKASGWTKEEAKDAAQAYLEYLCKEEKDSFPDSLQDENREEIVKEIDQVRDSWANSFWGLNISVSESTRKDYRDFYFEMAKKFKYSVGDAVETTDGFDIPVSIEPLTCFSGAEYVPVILMLDDDLTGEKLLERFYTRMLETQKELLKNASYGEPIELSLHLAKTDNSKDCIPSASDLEKITWLSYDLQYKWTADSAEKATSAMLKAIINKEYADMARWSLSTEEECSQLYGNDYSIESLREVYENEAKEYAEANGINEQFHISDTVLKKQSAAMQNLLAETKYKIKEVKAEGDDFVAYVEFEPIDVSGFEEEYKKRLEKAADNINTYQEYLDETCNTTADTLNYLVDKKKYKEPEVKEFHFKFDGDKMYSMDVDEVLSIYDMYPLF